MKHLIRYTISLLLLTAGLPLQAQTTSEAFYIYQNDGHFDGFFYDEVEKINISRLDTLGVEHSEFVSQEIVTADSTYRIMLSAIDSVGFQQPETRYKPQVHIKGESFLYRDFDDLAYYDYWDDEIIIFSKEIEERTKSYYYDEEAGQMVHWPLPQEGDVFVDFDKEGGGASGWSAKIVRLTHDYPGYEDNLVAICKPIDDITDIFQQFVSVEEYGYDDAGALVSRRVAGHPELNRGRHANRASGQWSGDLFNFSINTVFPLWDDGELSVKVFSELEGKLHVKTAWNLSLFGDKYISLFTKLNFGIGGGFAVDGELKKDLTTGIGKLGSVPVPATCPLFIINIGPDGFIRGEAHVNFTYKTAKLRGSYWSRLILNNWVPDFSMGWGSPDGDDEAKESGNSSSTTMSLNGFVQTGMMFPLTLESLPTIKKALNITTGSKVFVGPKLAADFTLDLTKMPWEDTAAYNQLKNITVQAHLLDADFEVKSKIKLPLVGEKEMDLASGSLSIFPPIDMKPVPEFGPCEEFYKEVYINDFGLGGDTYNCRWFAFEPTGFVLSPVYIGCQVLEMDENGKYDYRRYFDMDIRLLDMTTPYYHVAHAIGQELPKDKWARCFIKLEKGKTKPAAKTGKFKVRPVVWGPFHSQNSIPALPEYEYEYGVSRLEASGDTIYVDYDGSNSSTLSMTGTCSRLTNPALEVTGSDGNLSATFKKEFLYEYGYGSGKNYNPVKCRYDETSYQGETITDGEIFQTEKKPLVICVKPNLTEDPVEIMVSIEGLDPYYTLRIKSWTITRTEAGWYCTGSYSNHMRSVSCSFNIVSEEEGLGLVITNGSYNFKEFDNKGNVETELSESFGNVNISAPRYSSPGPTTAAKGKHIRFEILFQDALEE